MKEAAMNPHPTRRGLLGGLVASLLGLLQGARSRATFQGTPATPTPAVTPYTYDAGRLTTYTYDAGRLTSLTDPPGSVTTFVYDSQGWLLSSG
jgi:hypothetical protein